MQTDLSARYGPVDDTICKMICFSVGVQCSTGQKNVALWQIL